MDARLLDSLSYLSECAEKPLTTSFRCLREHLDGVRSRIQTFDLSLRGSVYSLHAHLVQMMRAGDLQAVRQLLEAVELVAPLKRGPRLVPLDTTTLTETEARAFLAVLSADYDSTYSRRFDASAPTWTETTSMCSITDSVLQKLELIDPATYGEIQALISDIVFIQSEHINAGTCFKAFGMLYLTVLREGQEWTTYLENIVHEAAHHYLFAVWTIDRIIERDGNKFYPSPLRTEPRPMSGIYHAMFVLARTIRVLNIFRSIPEYAPDVQRMSTGYNQSKNSASLEEKFLAAYKTVRENSILTPIGEKLLEGCREMALGI